MKQDFTLPSLQSMLDQLSSGKKLALAREQVDGLFGVDGVRSERLTHFAKGHDCIIVHEDSCVVFEKRSPTDRRQQADTA